MYIADAKFEEHFFNISRVFFNANTHSYRQYFKLLTERCHTYTTYNTKQYNILDDYLHYLPYVTLQGYGYAYAINSTTTCTSMSNRYLC